MGYLKITNLYKPEIYDQFINGEKVYVLDKVDGTSADISFNPKTQKVSFYSGGANHDQFVKLFDEAFLLKYFQTNFKSYHVTIYGEAYGGKIQGLSHRYGKDLKFVAFDVEIDEVWLDLPIAFSICNRLNLDFVDYELVDFSMEKLDELRDSPSPQSLKLGMGEHRREGVVIRPEIERTFISYGVPHRVIAKHKRAEEFERQTKVKPGQSLEVYTEANAIAEEWVTEVRLIHVLNKLHMLNFPELDISKTGQVCSAMVEDIYIEAGAEIIQSKDAEKAIKKLTANLFKQHIQNYAKAYQILNQPQLS